SSAVLDQPWPEVAGACASESPVDGTIVGIGALSIEPHRPSRSMPTESCHPISSPAFLHRSAYSEAPGRSPPSVWHSTGLAARIDLPRSIRPVLVVGNDEPNTRPNAERRRATLRPPDRSGPAPQAGRRAGGDRNATPQNAGFPVANSGRRGHRISRGVSSLQENTFRFHPQLLMTLCLALEHKQIPGVLHYGTANAKIAFEQSPFYVNAKLADWSSPEGQPRRTGVSSFGMGGTNSHAVLEEAPAGIVRNGNRASHSSQILVLSANSA